MILAGLKFTAHSPSCFQLEGRDLWLAYDGKTWFLNAQDDKGHIYYECPNRDVGANMLACAIGDAMEARK